MMTVWITRACVLAIAFAAPAVAHDTPLTARVAALLHARALPGTRFGIVVATGTGEEIVAIAPDDRFIPASNTKMFTTAAAFAMLGDVTAADTESGATVRLAAMAGGAPDVVLAGHGDARLSSAADCATDCLAELADAVAARVRVVGDVVGDDTAFPDERWSPGMSWNNLPTRSGTAVSALSIDDNLLAVTVTPGVIGRAATIAPNVVYAIDNRTVTVASGATAIAYDRLPGSATLRLSGTVAAGAEPARLRVAIDDPAHYAALRLKAMLAARGVRVRGTAVARHRPVDASDDPALRKGAPVVRVPAEVPLARLVPPPLSEDLTLTNKVSQNLHAELLLRRVGRIDGSGSIADGVAAVRAMLDRAGVARTAYDFSDGAGMSTYNRVSPRAAVAFLRWTTTQGWGAAWRDTLPVGAVDGTLARRFKGTPLAGKILAKTGTLNASAATAGFLTAASGRTLVFAVYANDVPGDGPVNAAVDAALELVAREN